MIRNEILFRELLRLGRAQRLYYLRALAPLAIGVMLTGLFVSENQQAGIEAFKWLMVVFNVFAFAAMPLLITGILHEEWQANTLSVLFLAETSIGAVLRGILGSRVVLVLVNLFACFPLLISVMNFGGVTVIQMVQFSLLMVSLTVFYGAFAMWASCRLRSREGALCFAFAALGLPQVAALYWRGFGVEAGVGALPWWLSWIPGVVMMDLTEGTIPWLVFEAAEQGARFGWLAANAVLLVAALLFFVLARQRLGRNLTALPGGREAAEVETHREHESIVGNPISWLVLKRFDPLFGIPKWLALTLAVAVSLALELIDPISNIPRHFVGLLGAVVMMWTLLWACLVSAQMWMEERTERTMELLLATPYTLDEVILWKVDALFWALVAPTAIYSVLLPPAVWAFIPNDGGVGLRVFLLAPFMMCCFLYSYVGLFVMVYLTIFFAIGATSAVQAVLSTIGLVGGAIFVNAIGFGFGLNSGLFLLALLFDVGLLCGFVPLFRRRIRGFELR